MMTRAQMRRQLYNNGGISSLRQSYGVGSWVKEKIRKIIPNELADLAVKAAPFVAMIPGYGPAAAGIMRGVGRFDQRGSIGDALKQGVGTYAGGKLFNKGMTSAGFRDAGASGYKEFLNQGTKDSIGGFFKGTEGTPIDGKVKVPGDPNITPPKTPGIMERTTDKLFSKVPFGDKIPQLVKEQFVVGGIISGGKALYDFIVGGYPEPKPGEDMTEYLEKRKKRVGTQMRTYMDSYLTYDPQYSAMNDEQRNEFVARYNKNQGGLMRQNYQTGGISMDLVNPDMKKSLAENVQKLSTQPRAQNTDLRDFFTNQATSQAARSMARTAGGYPSFLQMSPENISQARKLTYPQAFALEKQYKYNPNYAGADKTSRLGYLKQGLQSIAGVQKPGSNVGGATPLTRKLVLDAGEKVLPALGKGLTAVASLPAQAALMTLSPTTANADEVGMTAQDFQNLYNSPEEQAAREADKARQVATIDPTPTPDADNNYSGSFQEYLMNREPLGEAMTETEFNQRTNAMPQGSPGQLNPTPTYDPRSAGAIITDGDSKYKINADGSRTLIGKIGEATPTQNADPKQLTLDGVFGNIKIPFYGDAPGYLDDYVYPGGGDPNSAGNADAKAMVDKAKALYYSQKPTMADVAGPSPDVGTNLT